MEKTCKACGKSAPQTARYCPACGHSVETDEERTERRRKTRRTVLIVIASLAVIMGLAAWMIYRTITGLTGVVREPVETYLDHLKAGRQTKAWEMTAGTFQQRVPRENYALYLRERPFLVTTSSNSFSSYEYKGGIAYVRGTLTDADGSKTPVEFQLLKENDVWRIRSAEQR